MGREFASACARWIHLSPIGTRPRIAAVCDTSPDVLAWYERLDPQPRLVSDYRQVLEDDTIEAVYVAVPHNLHEEIYIACLHSGKHLLGEKPFGIDMAANTAINAEIGAHPDLLVRCSSELAVLSRRPGGRAFRSRTPLRTPDRDAGAVSPRERPRPGEADQLEAHCPTQRRVRLHGRPRYPRASPAATRRLGADQRPSDPDRHRLRPTRRTRRHGPCDTWDNAVLLCEVEDEGRVFPLRLETKRIAPGETNTWTVEIDGTEGSIAYTTKYPKTLRRMEYRSGGPQAWQTVDLGSISAYPHYDRRHLRVRVLRRDSSDVGGVRGRTCKWARRDVPTVLLRHP